MSFILGAFTGVAIMCVLSIVRDDEDEFEMDIEEEKK